MGIKHETITPTVIVPVKTGKEQSFKIRTLLDSGSSANWITRDMLQFITHESLGTCKVTVHHFGGVKSQKFQVVKIYIDTKNSLFKNKVDNKYKDQISIDCFVSDDFTFHRLVSGIKDYIRENYTLTDYVLNRIIEPDSLDISHANIHRGTGLILGNSVKIKIMGRKSTNIRLSRINLLLEQTIFGYVVSGMIPDKLMSKTNDTENNKIVSLMAHTINLSTCFPIKEYFPNCQIGSSPDLGFLDSMEGTCLEKDLSLGVIKNENPVDHENNINLVKENIRFDKITKPNFIPQFLNDIDNFLDTNKMPAKLRSNKENKKLVIEDKVIKKKLRKSINMDNCDMDLSDMLKKYRKCNVFKLQHCNFKFRRKKITAILGQVQRYRIRKSLWINCFRRSLKRLYSLEKAKTDNFDRNFYIEDLDAIIDNNPCSTMNDEWIPKRFLRILLKISQCIKKKTKYLKTLGKTIKVDTLKLWVRPEKL